MRYFRGSGPAKDLKQIVRLMPFIHVKLDEMRVCANRKRFARNFVIHYEIIGCKLLPRLGIA